MRILLIAAFLPVPGIQEDNDVLFKTVDEYRNIYPEDEFRFLKPQQYSNAVLGLFSAKLKQYNQVIEQKTYHFGQHHVDVLPYLTKRSMPLAHSLLSSSLYYANPGYVAQLTNDTDLIHAQHLYPDGLFAYRIKRRYGIPYVLTVRTDTDYFSIATSSQALAILRNAKSVIALSPRIQAYIRKVTGIEPVLIPHGIDDAFFTQQTEAPEAAPLRVLSVGRLLKLKNFDVVLRALAALREKFNFTYTIVGEGPEKGALMELAGRLGLTDRVTFTGAVAYGEIPGIMARHDLFVQPSFPEVLGRVYFEAMAAGLPIVHAKNTGVDGYYAQSAAPGIAVPPEDKTAIQQALALLLDSPELRKTMAAAGRNLVVRYTWPAISQRFHEIYHGNDDLAEISR